MMRYTAAALFMLISALANAQSPEQGQYGRFVIAADNVGPSTPMPYPNIVTNGGSFPHWVVDAQTSAGDTLGDVETWLPWQRWEQLSELGIDLALITLDNRAMQPTGGAENVLSAAAANGIDVGLSDMGRQNGGLYAYSGLTRGYYHLESGYDMEIWHPQQVANTNFDRAGFGLDKYPLEFNRTINAVRYSSQNQDPVMWGYLSRWAGLATKHECNLKKGGEYYISLSLYYNPDLQDPGHKILDNDSTIFRLKILDKVDGNWDVVHELRLTGREFSGVSGYSEVLMGIVRIEQNSSLQFTLRGLTAGTVDSVGDNSALPNIDQGRIMPGQFLRYELEYMPFDTIRPVIDVDALVVSDGKAFALFNPDHVSLHSAWKTVRPIDHIDAQIDLLAGFANPPRLLMFKESGEMSGNNGSMRFLLRRVAAKGLLGYLYSAAPSEHRLNYFTAAYRSFLQGPYHYPFRAFRDSAFGAPDNRTTVLLPTALPDDPGYYDQQFPGYNTGWGMQSLIEYYRSSAKKRAMQKSQEDFIPAVQNHSYGFADGFPNGGTTDDTHWSREPTTRELRAAVNLALAYGAHGIVYYVFCPWEGADTTDLSTAGYRGFLNTDYTPRRIDRYGQSVYDSIGAFNRDYLREMGDTLYGMKWVAGYSVEASNTPGGIGDLVGYVIAERPYISIDPANETYVEVSEFVRTESADQSELQYLFVVNKRTREGDHRHITVILRPDGTDEWKVTNVLTGDIWFVQSSDNPDDTATASGFTDYFEPGGAGLYRLEAIENE